MDRASSDCDRPYVASSLKPLGNPSPVASEQGSLPSWKAGQQKSARRSRFRQEKGYIKF
ncbi:MAG: hypothetical protein KME31_27740 [Tolypothrix carrinoi HA7290-LM1]|nr:hypothetical protein [Tolypothrix carrinoi HA7290-LM1]